MGSLKEGICGYEWEWRELFRCECLYLNLAGTSVPANRITGVVWSGVVSTDCKSFDKFKRNEKEVVNTELSRIRETQTQHKRDKSLAPGNTLC